MNLRPVDSVEVFSLVDNTIEMMYHVGRHDVQRPFEWSDSPDDLGMTVAEHGFAALVRTYIGGESHTLLFDTGAQADTVVENARRLTLDLNPVEAVFVSHGHWDHYGGLISALKAIGKHAVPVLMHDNMFLPLGWRDKDGEIHESARNPFPTAEVIRAVGGAPTDTAAPTLIARDTMLVTGEIPRRTPYETGIPGVVIKVDGAWQPYEDMRDERAIVIDVKDVGAFVISGCSHAGIVNTVRYALELVGHDRLHMVMGGFHLAGERVEPRIPQTVHDLTATEPALLVPCHCTGFPAAMAFAQAAPDAFVADSVGNRYVVGALARG